MTAKGSLDRRRMVLLRLVTEAGATGLGEAVPLSLRGGVSLETVVGELEAWGELAVAASTGAERPLAMMSAPARAAVAMATADARAREAGLPLWRLLRRERGDDDGAGPRAVVCNATLTSGEPGDVLAQAEAWAADGFTTFKLKLGAGRDFEQVEAVRRGLGPDVGIRVDVNAEWDLDEATRMLTRLEPLGIELAEQPVDGLEAMSELRRRCGVRIVADESVASEADAAEAARLGACDAATVKLSKIGGLDATLGGHLPTYLSSALDGPVGIAAAAHVAQTLPGNGRWADVAHGLATERLFSATVAAEGGLLDGPLLRPPGGNGLGITIDEPALAAHRL